MDLAEWTWVEKGILALAAFVACLAWEVLHPIRPARHAPWRRYGTNVVLGAANVALVRVLFGTSVVSIAGTARANGWGLLNALDVGPIAGAVATVALFDFVAWGMHRLYHEVPLLWRLHAVHHTDRDLNVTTAIRFHPIEIVLSTAVRFAVVAVLGADPVGVVVFEALFLAANDWQHTNVGLPPRVDDWARRVFVTPNMHRTHHAVEPRRTHSNFGVILSWWDRWFRTHDPLRDVRALELGLPGGSDPLAHLEGPELLALLRMPFDRSSAPPRA